MDAALRMSLLHPFYPGAAAGYALYPGAPAGPSTGPGAPRPGHHSAFLPGMLPPHLPVALPADYTQALGMSLSLPTVGFPMLTTAHCTTSHPDSALVASVTKAAAAAVYSNHHKLINNNANNNNNNNRTQGQLTKFTIDEILGKKSSEDHRPKSQGGSSSTSSVVATPGRSPPSSSGGMISSSSGPLNGECGGDTMVNLDGSSSRDCSSSPGTQEAENPDDLDPNARFSWLQCTRYRPPKLPRE